MGKAVMTLRQRMAWVTGFANDDLGGLRRDDWLELELAIGRFVQPVGLPDVGTFPMTVGAMRKLQGTALEILTRLSEPRTDRSLERAAPASVRWRATRGGPLQVTGPLKDVFVTQLCRLLLEGGPEHVRRCPAPGCATLFWKAGRRKFCSTRCTNRASFETWRHGPRGADRNASEAGAARGRRAYKRRLADLRRRRAR